MRDPAAAISDVHHERFATCPVMPFSAEPHRTHDLIHHQKFLIAVNDQWHRCLHGVCWELQNKVASKGRGILAMDESNATCGKRLDSVGVENTEDNRRAYRELLISTPGLGQYISGAILFEETLYQKASSGKTFVDVMGDQGIIPGEYLAPRVSMDGSFSPNTAGFGHLQRCRCIFFARYHAQLQSFPRRANAGEATSIALR